MTRQINACVLLIAVVLSFETCLGQVATGAPAFGSFGGLFDTVNLGNLNVHFSVPVLDKAGRGLPFNYDIGYDSSVWYPAGVSGSQTWTPVINWGWVGGTQGTTGYVRRTSPGITWCSVNGKKTGYIQTFTNWQYHDTFGVAHPFVGTDQQVNGTCSGQGNTGFSSTATDGSGYVIQTNGGSYAAITSRSGQQILPPVGATSGAGTSTDANGNQITVNSSGVFTDTLNQTALTVAGAAPSPVTFTYTAPSGAGAAVSMNYTSYTVQTNFGCTSPAVADYGPTQVYLVSSIGLPDGTSYSFTYEVTPGHSPNVTGRIASMTLPTGGTIAYTYTGGNNGIICAEGSTAGLNRQLNPGGTWTYTRSGSGNSWTTTIIDPKTPGNNTVINFRQDSATSNASNNFYETQRKVYQGSATGTPLSTTITCYNGNNVTNPSVCPTTSVATPILRMTTFRYLPDSTGVMAETDSTYDQFGLIHEVDEYDYGTVASGAPGAVLRKTITNYTAPGNGIVDRPSSVVIEDASNAAKASTTYTYDDPGTLTATFGIPQHVAVSGSRGNLTSVAAQVNGSTTLYRKFTYYDLGTLNTSTDVSTSSTTNGSITTYNYTSGSASCNSAFPTSISEPLSLSRSMSWNCVGAVLISLTDENGKQSSTSYTDPYFWRPYSSTDNAGNTTIFTYSPDANTSLPTQTESTLLFNSNNSVVDQLSTVDGFGRPMLSQRKQGPSATNYDTVESDYDVSGCGVSRTTLPYSATQGQTNLTAPGTSTAYDGACRPTAVTDSGGASTTYTYTYNDTYQTVGPAPSGENSKRKQLEYGGLGWLKSVCEITAGTGTAPAGTCAQSSHVTGYWTTYAYDSLGNQTGVTQNAQTGGTQQSRTLAYDMLGRLTSEINPETNKLAVTYYYDTLSSDPSCGTVTSAGNMLKQLDAAGNASCYVYDALHRVTSVTYPSTSTPQKNFVYDSATVNSVSMSNAKTRLAEAYTCTGTCTSKITDLGFSYSALGQVSDAYQYSTNSSGYYHVRSTFWPNGAVNTLSGLPGLPTITYGADAEGRANTVSASAGQNPVTAVTYNTARQVTAVTFGSTDNDAFTFDPNTGRMTQYQFNVGSGGSSTPAFVQSTYREQNANATSFSTAFTSNVTSGDLLFVTFANSTTNSINAISDTLGNTYTALPLIANGYRLQAFYTFSTASGADTVTGTYSGSGATYIQETLAEYSNVRALDAHAENSGGNSQPSTTTTTTASSDLVIGYVTDSFVTWTGETGWNLRTTASGIRAALQDTIAANPGSITSTFNTVNGWNAGIVAFKSAGGGGQVTDKGVLNWNANWSLGQLAITDQVYPGGSHTCNYSHDDLRRIATANCGTAWNQTFSYDAVGNIQKSATVGISFQPGYDVTTNRINTTPFTYDGNNGDLKTDNNHTYAWDTTGKMTSVDLGTSNGVCLTYDALGRMVEQGKGSSCTTSYSQIVYAPNGAKLAIMSGQTLAKAFVSLPSGQAVYTSSGLAYYRHQDWLGSSRLATMPTRTMYYDTAYAPFGENYLGSGTMDLSFTGQNQDTIGGGIPGNLYDFLYRQHTPVQGRWLSPDPAGRAAANPSDPQTWNRYAYVANRPLGATDALGLIESKIPPGPPGAPCDPWDVTCVEPNPCDPSIYPCDPGWPGDGGGGGGGGIGGGGGGNGSTRPEQQRRGGVWPNNETMGLPQGLNASPVNLANLFDLFPGLCNNTSSSLGFLTTGGGSGTGTCDIGLKLSALSVAVGQAFASTGDKEKDKPNPNQPGQQCPCYLIAGAMRALSCTFSCTCPGPPPIKVTSILKCRLTDPYAHMLCPGTVTITYRPAFPVHTPPPGFCGPAGKPN